MKPGETARYRRIDDGMIVDVDVFLEEGHWYARMWNDEAGITVGDIHLPSSPWCLEISDFGKRYKPVALPPKLGEVI